MGFLDYVRKENNQKKREKIANRKAKMPLLIVMLGYYSGNEIEMFTDYLDDHIALSERVCWATMQDCAEIKGNRFEIPYTNKEFTSLQNREWYTQEAGSEKMQVLIDGFAGKMFNKLAGVEFEEKNSIRIAILVKTDQASSGLLFYMAKALVDYFSVYYTSKVYLEIYNIINQGGVSLEKRKTRWASNYLTMQDTVKLYTEEMKQDRTGTVAHMVYFMSNIKNSGIMMREDEYLRELYRSIALVLTAKILEGDNINYTYKDIDFGNGIKNKSLEKGMDKEGVICSAGCIHMEKNDYLIRLIVYRTIWHELGKIHEDLDMDALRRRLSISPDDLKNLAARKNNMRSITTMDLKSIVRNPVNTDMIYQNKNGDAVQKIFGKHLDLFMQLNANISGEDEGTLEEWPQNLEYRLKQKDYTHEAGPLDIDRLLLDMETELSNNSRQAEDLSQKAKEDFEEWKDKGTNIGRRASEEELLQTLAKNYCVMRMKFQNAEIEMNNYEMLLRHVQRVGKSYHSFVSFIQDTVGQLTEEINSICEVQKGTGVLQTANTKEFYENLVKNELESGIAFRRLSDTLTEYIGDTDGLMDKVFQFCNEEILKRPEFSRGFLDELLQRMPGYRTMSGREVRTDKDVFDQLLITIDAEAHYLCKDIHDGFDNYRASLYFLSDMAFGGKNYSYEPMQATLIQKGGFYLFCDKYCDQFDVVYLVGNIYPDLIYHMEQYKREYLALCGEE